MTHTSYGIAINAHPPITTISVNKFSVVFKDSQKIKSINFKDAIATKNFINWLVSI